MSDSMSLLPDSSSPCPCGSGKSYGDCCRPYHLAQAYAESAEQLMRSRYSAYALQLENYLLKTWAETTRPAEIGFENGLSWQKLTIVATKKGRKNDRQGTVKFIAEFQLGLDRDSMSETSRFSRDEKNHWVYVDGDVS